MDDWESDLVEFQALSKFNNNYKYILSVIDVFQTSTSGPSKVQDRYSCSVGVSVDVQGSEIL